MKKSAAEKQVENIIKVEIKLSAIMQAEDLLRIISSADRCLPKQG